MRLLTIILLGFLASSALAQVKPLSGSQLTVTDYIKIRNSVKLQGVKNVFAAADTMNEVNTVTPRWVTGNVARLYSKTDTVTVHVAGSGTAPVISGTPLIFRSILVDGVAAAIMDSAINIVTTGGGGGGGGTGLRDSILDKSASFSAAAAVSVANRQFTYYVSGTSSAETVTALPDLTAANNGKYFFIYNLSGFGIFLPELIYAAPSDMITFIGAGVKCKITVEYYNNRYRIITW